MWSKDIYNHLSTGKAKQEDTAPKKLIEPKILTNCEELGKNYVSLLGKCYYVEGTEMNFTAASKNCEEKFGSFGKGKLFEPMNKQVNEKVIKAARKIDIRSLRFFLGIMDADSSNNWTYHSDGKPVTWTNWDSDQPNNGRLCCNGEDCTVGGFRIHDYKWHDDSCYDSHPSICEHSMVPISKIKGEQKFERNIAI